MVVVVVVVVVVVKLYALFNVLPLLIGQQ